MTDTSRKPDPIIVADAMAQDADQLTAIVRASRAYEGEYQAMVADDTITVDDLDEHLVRVARDSDGGVCGFYLLMIPGRGGEGECELDYLFVDNDQQGRGIGRLLLDDMRGEVVRRGLRAVHIVSHPPSEAFYRGLGARQVGEVEPHGTITWTRPHLLLDL